MPERTSAGGVGTGGHRADPAPGPRPRRRADAERNRVAIVEAALALFVERPEATMTEIAAAAGVGRVTLYAHFPSRHDLLEAVVDRAVAEAVAEQSDAGDPDAPAAESVRALVRSSWRSVHRFGRLSAMVQREMEAGRLRARHGPILDRVTTLVAQGQAEGVFRTDLPCDWLATTIYSIVHAAADAVDAGRLDADAAADVLEATLLPVLLPPPNAPGPARDAGG